MRRTVCGLPATPVNTSGQSSPLSGEFVRLNRSSCWNVAKVWGRQTCATGLYKPWTCGFRQRLYIGPNRAAGLWGRRTVYALKRRAQLTSFAGFVALHGQIYLVLKDDKDFRNPIVVHLNTNDLGRGTCSRLKIMSSRLYQSGNAARLPCQLPAHSSSDSWLYFLAC